MFLQKEETLSLIANSNDKRIMYLEPLNCPNVKTLYSNSTFELNGANKKIWNWDKISILAIYIRIQPRRNNFAGGNNAEDSIAPIKCYYALNNLIAEGDNNQKLYDEDLLDSKNLFTFNSNESFTIVIKAPSTMSQNSPCIHKAYTWWSIADINSNTDSPIFKNENNFEGDDSSDEYENYGNPLANNKDKVHCGYLYFKTTVTCSFNVSVSYKVALKG